MGIFDKLFNKPKKPMIKKIVTCSKHGIVPSFALHIVGRKDYEICWDCIGEFGSQYVTTQITEVE